jgi:hypothetical protein
MSEGGKLIDRGSRMENGRGNAALFDDALGAEIAEIGRAQTQESAQDLVGVLASAGASSRMLAGVFDR